MAVVHRRRRGGLGYIGLVRGDIDPTTGQVWDGYKWLTPNDGESENLSTALKSYMNDPFAGMSDADIALYWAGQGAGGSSAFFAPAGTTGATFDAAAAVATQANADAYVAANPDRLAYLNNLVQTAQATELAQKNLAVATQNAITQEQDVRRELADLLAAGAVFADTIPSGMGYTAAFLKGMVTTEQWVADRISVLNGGQPTNAQAMAGRLPALPAGAYVIGSSTDPNKGLTSPSTGASMLPTYGTNPDGSTVVWNTTTQRWDPVQDGGGNAFADANPGSAGANFLPSGGPSMPGGSDMGGGAFGLPGGVSPGLLVAGALAAFLVIRRKGGR